MRTGAIIRHAATALVCVFVAAAAGAAEHRTEHTFGLAEGETAPAATLDDAAWLIGTWKGKAFGQDFEQFWSAPSADSMIGTFKLMNEGDVSFYELLMLSVDEGTLSLKVKHFNPDFTAWEDKADFINFRLVKFDEDELHFSGLSFYRRDDGNMDAYIVMRSDAGLREEKLVYRRD